jgi:hypothetical protein
MRRIVLCLICCAAMSPIVAQRAPDIARGTTSEAVIRAYGWPKGKSVTDGRQIWLYENFQVMFEDAKVVTVSYASSGATNSKSRRISAPMAGIGGGQTRAVPQPSAVRTKAASAPTQPPATPAVRASASRPPAIRVEMPSATMPTVAASAGTPRARSNKTGGWMLTIGMVAAVVVAVLAKKRRQKMAAVSLVEATPALVAPPRWQDHVAEKLRTAKTVTECSRPGADSGREAPALPAGADATPADAFTELTSQLLGELEWKRFEMLVELYFRETGVRAEPTCIGADGGVDVNLYRPGEQRPYCYVQCKAWTTWRVDVKAVRELYGVMAADGVGEGVFATTGEYTSEARAFAAGKLLLLDGAEIITRFNQLPPEARKRILAIVTEGDYTTPTCARCDTKMILREGETPFWGCRNFPRCPATIRVSRAKLSSPS